MLTKATTSLTFTFTIRKGQFCANSKAATSMDKRVFLKTGRWPTFTKNLCFSSNAPLWLAPTPDPKALSATAPFLHVSLILFRPMAVVEFIYWVFYTEPKVGLVKKLISFFEFKKKLQHDNCAGLWGCWGR
ncbi:MAG: hypothetical protein ACRCYP_04335 [Alphaproteobacteria bacterium]